MWVMTDLEPRPGENLDEVAHAIRQHNAFKIRNVIESLEPMIDGSYGPVNPRLVEVYLRALKELALLYPVYQRVQPKETDDPAKTEVRMEALRARAEAQLQALAQRAPGAPERA